MKSNSINMNRFLLYTLFLNLSIYSQKVSTHINTYELTAATSQFNYSISGQRYGFGTSLEFYITERISVRGSLLFNSNYCRFSFAPLFWTTVPKDSRKIPDYLIDNSIHKRSILGRVKYPLLSLIASLLVSDGFAYNIKINNRLYFSPYIAPIQLHIYAQNALITNSKGNLIFDDNGILVTSIGTSLKGYISKHLVINIGAEYSRSCAFRDGGQGYTINASFGYIFRKH